MNFPVAGVDATLDGLRRWTAWPGLSPKRHDHKTKQIFSLTCKKTGYVRNEYKRENFPAVRQTFTAFLLVRGAYHSCPRERYLQPLQISCPDLEILLVVGRVTPMKQPGLETFEREPSSFTVAIDGIAMLVEGCMCRVPAQGTRLWAQPSEKRAYEAEQ